jgi:hypothetical protein
MRKKLIYSIILSSLFFYSSCFELFPVEKREVSNVSFDNGISCKAYSIATGATTKEAIQIWRTKKSDEKLITTYEDFDSAYLSTYGEGRLVVALFKDNLGIVKIDTINTEE